ncbi:hypothetical protein [Thermotalea metallivorans]|uniref:Uncharacterized protein n=1 Tax=Thermotalea metallivorans TaxID=520762 RepID=A0A140L0Q3_9FIRM|nr:hypothetical protein [Thermotalea metallivorans]KXG74128.1 hypothetical protein AN619_26430 [Thermotalea metallivorans]
MASDIRFVRSTQPERISTTTQASLAGFISTSAGATLLAALNPGVAIGTIIGVLIGAIDVVYGTTAINGWVRYFEFVDYSTNDRVVEMYVYSSYTDAVNDVGREFLGGVNKVPSIVTRDFKSL